MFAARGLSRTSAANLTPSQSSSVARVKTTNEIDETTLGLSDVPHTVDPRESLGDPGAQRPRLSPTSTIFERSAALRPGPLPRSPGSRSRARCKGGSPRSYRGQGSSRPGRLDDFHGQFQVHDHILSPRISAAANQDPCPHYSTLRPRGAAASTRPGSSALIGSATSPGSWRMRSWKTAHNSQVGFRREM